MTIELNHTIVPARDKEESARFYERMFGFKYEGPMGHFAPIRIPSQDHGNGVPMTMCSRK